MDTWKKCVLSAGKAMSIKFLVLGGGGILGLGGGGSADFIFMGTGIFLKVGKQYRHAGVWAKPIGSRGHGFKPCADSFSMCPSIHRRHLKGGGGNDGRSLLDCFWSCYPYSSKLPKGSRELVLREDCRKVSKLDFLMILTVCKLGAL